MNKQMIVNMKPYNDYYFFCSDWRIRKARLQKIHLCENESQIEVFYLCAFVQLEDKTSPALVFRMNEDFSRANACDKYPFFDCKNSLDCHRSNFDILNIVECTENTTYIKMIEKVLQELISADKKHNPTFWDLHHGYAVLKKEVDELWDNIKNDEPSHYVIEEAIQVAAMAIKLATRCGGNDDSVQKMR